MNRRELYFNISIWAFWIFIISSILPLIGDLCVLHIINSCRDGILFPHPWAEIIIELGYIAIAVYFYASAKAYLNKFYRYMTIPAVALGIAGIFEVWASINPALEPIDSNIIRWFRIVLLISIILFWAVESIFIKKRQAW